MSVDDVADVAVDVADDVAGAVDESIQAFLHEVDAEILHAQSHKNDRMQVPAEQTAATQVKPDNQAKADKKKASHLPCLIINYMGKKDFNAKLRFLCSQVQENKKALPAETRKINSERMFAALRPLFTIRTETSWELSNETDKKEKGVAIWAFAESCSLQYSLLNFLQSILLPRVFVYSETRKAQVEALFLTRLQPVTGLKVVEFENWFEQFSNIMNMSAGVTILESYMDPAMLTCIDRIEHGRIETLRHNFHFHADFLQLYRTKLQAQHERANVNLATNGLEFTPREMIALYEQNRTLRSSLLQQNALERRFFHSIQEQNNNNSIALQIVQGLFLTNAIPQAARDDIQTLLLPRFQLVSHEQANRAALDRLFVCFRPWVEVD